MSKKTSTYIHQYETEHYDRIIIKVPKGNKPAIVEHAKAKGCPSVNQLIQRLLLADMGLQDWPVRPKKDGGDDDDIYMNW